MTSKKKRLIALIALVAVLAAAVGVLVWLKNRPEETEPYVSPYTSLVSEDSSTITKLAFGNVGDKMLEFIRADYMWSYPEDESFPVNGAILDEMASTVSSVSAERTIDGEEKSDYGLGDGALHITAEYANGDKIDLTVGALNSYNSSTYIKNGDGKIYMFTDSLSEQFTKELNDLIKLDDPEATVDTNYLVSLDVSDGEGRANSVTDTAGMRNLLSQSDVYECIDWVDYAVTPERFAEYGITPDSARLTIRYKAGKSVTDENGESTTIRVEEQYEIIFGEHVTAEDDNGESAEYVYYTVTGSTIVYKAPIADYEATMAYLDYVPDGADGTAASPDSETDAPAETLTDSETD